MFDVDVENDVFDVENGVFDVENNVFDIEHDVCDVAKQRRNHRFRYRKKMLSTSRKVLTIIPWRQKCFEFVIDHVWEELSLWKVGLVSEQMSKYSSWKPGENLTEFVEICQEIAEFVFANAKYRAISFCPQFGISNYHVFVYTCWFFRLLSIRNLFW